jgi:uncharacterized membrane protein YfcA
MDVGAFIFVFVVVTATAAIQGAAGYGLNVIAAPLLMLVDPSLVPGPMMVAAFVLTALMIWRNRDGLELRSVRWMVFGALPGTALASLLLPYIPVRELSFILAGLVLAGVVFSLTGLRFPPLRSVLFGAGFLSGLAGTLSSIGGPPVALVNQELKGAHLRATLSSYFIVLSVISVAGMVLAGRFGGTEMVKGLLLLPGIVAGFLLSKPFAAYLDRGYTRYVILGVSALAGVLLLIQQIFH